MRRFFAEPSECEGSKIELDERESRHLAQVLRARAGEGVTVLDGAGGEYECEVENAGKRRVTLEVLARVKHEPLPYRLELFQAIPKGKTMDWIVQKATELGVERIVPIVTDRTVVEIEADSAKVEKWRAIAIESIKQCGSPWLPRIERPMPLKEALSKVRALALVASLHPGAREIHEHFEAGVSDRTQIWVGPEGDFTPSEVEALVARGARPITLGSLVLRCDTAAIASLALAGHCQRRALNH